MPLHHVTINIMACMYSVHSTAACFGLPLLFSWQLNLTNFLKCKASDHTGWDGKKHNIFGETVPLKQDNPKLLDDAITFTYTPLQQTIRYLIKKTLSLLTPLSALPKIKSYFHIRFAQTNSLTCFFVALCFCSAATGTN